MKTTTKQITDFSNAVADLTRAADLLQLASQSVMPVVVTDPSRIAAPEGIPKNALVLPMGGTGSGKGGSTTAALPASLSSLTDTTITTPVAGQGIVWNATTSRWENQTIAGEQVFVDTFPATPVPNQVSFIYNQTDANDNGVYRYDGPSGTWVQEAAINGGTGATGSSIQADIGQVTVLAANQSQTFAHNLGALPDTIIIQDVSGKGNATESNVANITTTTFDIELDVNPGADSAFDFVALKI